MFGTTPLFLEQFVLKYQSELPPLEDFAPDEESKRFIRERLSGRQIGSTLEEAADDLEDERDLLGNDFEDADGSSDDGEAFGDE